MLKVLMIRGNDCESNKIEIYCSTEVITYKLSSTAIKEHIIIQK